MYSNITTNIRMYLQYLHLSQIIYTTLHYKVSYKYYQRSRRR